MGSVLCGLLLRGVLTKLTTRWRFPRYDRVFKTHWGSKDDAAAEDDRLLQVIRLLNMIEYRKVIGLLKIVGFEARDDKAPKHGRATRDHGVCLCLYFRTDSPPN